MAALPLIAAVASTAFTVVGAIQQGNAASASAKSDQNAAEYNAQLDANKAKATNQQWSAREDIQRRQRRIALGEQRAGIAQSGLTDTGSVLDMFDQSAVDSELDILNNRYEGQAQAKGFNDAATLDKYSAKAAGNRASAARTGGWINAGASLMSGASNVYGAYQKYKAPAPTSGTLKSEGLIK